MKKVWIVGVAILVITLFIAVANMVIGPFPDWSVRITHIVMLIAIVTVTFCTIRMKKENS